MGLGFRLYVRHHGLDRASEHSRVPTCGPYDQFMVTVACTAKPCTPLLHSGDHGYPKPLNPKP